MQQHELQNHSSDKVIGEVSQIKAPPGSQIFLDINIPRMNGCKFLEEYKKLDKEMKAQIVVVMLTT